MVIKANGRIMILLRLLDAKLRETVNWHAKLEETYHHFFFGGDVGTQSSFYPVISDHGRYGDPATLKVILTRIPDHFMDLDVVTGRPTYHSTVIRETGRATTAKPAVRTAYP